MVEREVCVVAGVVANPELLQLQAGSPLLGGRREYLIHNDRTAERLVIADLTGCSGDG